MKISTSTSIVIIEPDMQKDIHHALKHCGVVSSYQIFGFIVDARVVNNGQAIIFDAYFPINDEQNTMKYHETFMIKWSDFENFYLLNRGGV